MSNLENKMKILIITLFMSLSLVSCAQADQANKIITENNLVPQISFQDYDDEKECDISYVGFTNNFLSKAIRSQGIEDEKGYYLFNFSTCRKGLIDNSTFLIYQIWHKDKPITYILFLSKDAPYHAMVTVTDTSSDDQERQWISQGQRTYDNNLKNNTIWKNVLDQYIDEKKYAR